MKKNRVTVFVIILLISFGVFLQYNKKPSGFLVIYREEIRYYKEWPIEERIKDFGYAGTEEEAIAKTKKFFSEHYYEAYFDENGPFYVEFDGINKLWHVYNKPEGYIGEAHIIFRQVDGRVLAFWVYA